ncbi:bifunctional Delta(1)-pyrroline-2-carboxylate/Delta(1)-piperideine-2-carboxylate reductase [Neorhizobium petrolearium]|uniref:Ornithine cyclodeaminase family protein n=1 Tax=Neorhizobium petrolearium TaxID=515361 RepID=A0ABY8M2K3_9HYPH|nr:ornithine cyclodeaminase family protein [Neorhizobium petrolearium]MCC2612864.1 ornithine cyclodeaminase family protein [Neorhizobium petrolearium]WGI67974.1 ornithine cyclodeaminase family protein [Neorhizobium petrolearium]
MLVLSEEETRKALPFKELIDAIERMFRSNCVMPVRHHHEMEVPGEASAVMLLMPAWVPGDHIGVKILNLFPDNHLRALPTIIGSYLLSSGKTGEMLAIVEGGELTARRTAATSALAARYLAREESETMLMVGTGRLSLNLIQAHAVTRPLKRFLVWGRGYEKAEETSKEARGLGFDAVAVDDLGAAACQADIISCATLSSQPLIRGEWLKPGTHLDLVGAFKPSMRESDDEAVRRSFVFVDTRAGAAQEGGDIVQPLASGILAMEDIKAELAELARGKHPGRTRVDEITLFKSVGAALEDLAGAILAYQHASGQVSG